MRVSLPVLVLIVPTCATAEPPEHWSTTVGRVAPDLPPPEGEILVDATDGTVPITFRMPGETGTVWPGWRERLEGAGYRVTDVVEEDPSHVVVHLAGPGEGRGSVALSHYQGQVSGALDWVARPETLPLSSPCVTPPARQYVLEIVSREANPPPDREDPVPFQRAYRTRPLVDVDGDGRLDVIVPTVQAGNCPHEVQHTIYVMRGSCGHEVGKVLGFPRLAAPRRPGVLADLQTTRDWTEITDPQRPPGPSNVATRFEEVIHYRGGSGSYVATDRERTGGICHHCGIARCRALSGP